MVGRIDGPNNVNYVNNPPPPPSMVTMNNLMADMIANPNNIAKDKAELQQIDNQYHSLFGPVQQDTIKALLGCDNDSGVMNCACKYLISMLPNPTNIELAKINYDIKLAQLTGNYAPFFADLKTDGVPITNQGLD